MRLIDADRLLDSLRGNVLIDVTTELEDAVNKQPTIGYRDITPEMAIAAYNVMRQYADNRTASECDTCIFTDICIGVFCDCPNVWPDLEVPDD